MLREQLLEEVPREGFSGQRLQEDLALLAIQTRGRAGITATVLQEGGSTQFSFLLHHIWKDDLGRCDCV